MLLKLTLSTLLLCSQLAYASSDDYILTGSNARELYNALSTRARTTPNSAVRTKEVAADFVCTINHRYGDMCRISKHAGDATAKRAYLALRTLDIYTYSDSTAPYAAPIKSKYIQGLKISYSKPFVSTSPYAGYKISFEKKIPELEGPLRTLDRRVWTKDGAISKNIYEELFRTVRERYQRDARGTIIKSLRTRDNTTCTKQYNKGLGRYVYHCELNVEVKTRMVGRY